MKLFLFALLMTALSAHAQPESFSLDSIDPFFRAVARITKGKDYTKADYEKVRKIAEEELAYIPFESDERTGAVHFLQSNPHFIKKTGVRTLIKVRRIKEETARLCNRIAADQQSD